MFAGSEYILTNNLSSSSPTGKADRALSLFRKANFDAKTGKLLAALRRKSNRLDDLQSLPAAARNNNTHYLGLRTVALEKIHGSEGRTEDFDASFQPMNERSKDRWLSIAIVRENDVALPPVELIKVGEGYYVRDGHHRISVAHALGEDYVDAEVIEW